MAKHNIGDYSIEAGENGLETEAFSIEKLRTEPREVTVHVPTDYNTLNEAVNNVGDLMPPSTDARIEIVIEAGHEISEGVFCFFGDWSNVLISAEDSIVDVADDFPVDEDIFYLRYAWGPVIDTRIDANGQGRNGLYVRSHSFCQNTHGITNAGADGLKVENVSFANAYASDWSGAGDHGVRATRACNVTLGGGEGTTIENAGRNGLHVERGSNVRATQLSVSGCAESGILAREVGQIAAYNSTVTDCGGYGTRAISGSTIDMDSSSVSGEFEDAAVYSGGGATINARSCDIDSIGTWAVFARYGGTINTHNSIVVSDQSFDVTTRNGATINLSSTETSSSTGSQPHEDDIYLVAPNTINGEGIVFAEDYESSA